MLDSRLTMRTVVSGLNQPTNMAFLGPNDFLVLEKATGRVQRVVDGAIQSTVLDLAAVVCGGIAIVMMIRWMWGSDPGASHPPVDIAAESRYRCM